MSENNNASREMGHGDSFLSTGSVGPTNDALSPESIVAKVQRARHTNETVIQLEPALSRDEAGAASMTLKRNNNYGMDAAARKELMAAQNYANHDDDEAVKMREKIAGMIHDRSSGSLGMDAALGIRETIMAMAEEEESDDFLAVDSGLFRRIKASQFALRSSLDDTTSHSMQPLPITEEGDPDFLMKAMDSNAGEATHHDESLVGASTNQEAEQRRVITPGAQAVYPSDYTGSREPEEQDDFVADGMEVGATTAVYQEGTVAGVESLYNVAATVVDEEEVVEATKLKDAAKEQRRLKSYLAVVVLLLIVVVAVVVPIVVTQTGGSSDETVVVNTMVTPSSIPSSLPSFSTSPSLWPSFTPSSSPTSILQAFLGDVSLDGGAALAEIGSPQEQAMLTIQGELIVEPDMPAERILQRYALETFYFSTDGAQWTRNAIVWSIGASGNLVDECTWFGVTCGSGGNTTVVALELPDVGLFGTLPDELLLLSQLTLLRLRQNTLAGSIPVGLQQMSVLEILDLADNRLQFGFSSEMGSMSSLQNLDLAANSQLVWTLPTEMGLLSNMRNILIESTMLGGEIVSEIGKLTQLTSLFLNGNLLMGTIPSELGMLTQLVLLELNRNRLTGTIPTELGRLVRLTLLNVERNQLTGTIPSELGMLTNLTTLNLAAVHVNEMNRFTGTVSQGVCDAVAGDGIELGCSPLLVCPCSIVCGRHCP